MERLGYTAVWITGTREARLTIVERVLAATKTLAVATGVVNIWYQEARAVADSYHRLEAAYPGRFLLGIGAGHRELGTDFRSPYHALVDYIDVLDELGVPKQRRALAAPGPRVLMLAAERPAGAHPYLVTPAYTRRARELVGPDALLAVVHKVVLGDPASTRTAGRKSIQVNLGLANYRANLIRMGFGEDVLADGGSDALVDAPDLVPRAGGPALNQDGGLDFWPKNPFSRPRGQVVVIDWGFAGSGAIGEDAGNLVPDAVFDHFITADQMPHLEQIVCEGYLRGLRAVGCDDDPRLVQLGMWSSAVKYDWLAALTLAQVRQDRQYRYGGAGEIDPAFKFRERSRALLFNARWARQAIELASRLGL